MSGSTLDFTLQQTTAGCAGSFTGRAIVSGNAMDVTFSGADCNGPQAEGQGTLTRPDPATAVLGTAVDLHVTDEGEVLRPIDVTGNLELFVAGEEGAITRRSGTGSPLGTFTVPDVPAGSYTLRLGSVYVVSSSRQLDLGTVRFGRSAPQPAEAGTQIVLNATDLAPWQPQDDLELVATNAGLVTTMLPTFQQQIAAGATSVSGLRVPWAGLPLVDATQGDRAILAQLSSRQSDSGVSYASVARRLELPPFSMASGANTTVEGALVEVPQDQGALFEFKRSLFAVFEPEVNPVAATASQALYVFLLPGASTHGVYANGPNLLVAETGTSTYDLSTGVLRLGNPYPSSWDVVGSAQVSYLVGYSLPGARFPARVPAVITRTDTVDALSTHPIEPLVGPVGAPLVNGRDAFGSSAEVGTTPVLSWHPPALGIATYYTVGVNRLFVADGRPRREVVATLHTAETSLRIPPDILQTGEYYVFSITARHAPGASFATRPFRRVLPTATAQVLTGFVVP